MEKISISTHILDTSLGIPASQVNVQLYQLQPETEVWDLVLSRFTDSDGRYKDFITELVGGELGVYKLVFDTKSYFNRNNLKAFFPKVEVVFEADEFRHYHVPLLLSPYSYSTYRGS